MPNTFKNARLALTNSAVTAYTVPASTTTIVLQLQATNVDNSAAQAVTATWYDNSATATTNLVKALSVPANAAVGLLAGKLVLETGDYIQLSSTASSLIECTISVLEIS